MGIQVKTLMWTLSKKESNHTSLTGKADWKERWDGMEERRHCYPWVSEPSWMINWEKLYEPSK